MGKILSKNRSTTFSKEEWKMIKETSQDHQNEAAKSVHLGQKCLLKEQWNDALIHFSMAYNFLNIVQELKVSNMVDSKKKDKKLKNLNDIKTDIILILTELEAKVSDIEARKKEEQDIQIQHPEPRKLPNFNYDGYTKEEKEMLMPILRNFCITNPPIVEWDQIIGCETAKSLFKSVSDSYFDPLIAPLYEEGEYQREKGILMFGPPGCGEYYKVNLT